MLLGLVCWFPQNALSQDQADALRACTAEVTARLGDEAAVKAERYRRASGGLRLQLRVQENAAAAKQRVQCIVKDDAVASIKNSDGEELAAATPS